MTVKLDFKADERAALLSLDRVTAGVSKLGLTASKVATNTNKLGTINLKSAQVGLKDLNKELQTLNSNVKTNIDGFKSLATAAATFAGVTFGATALGRAGDALLVMENRLATVIGRSDELETTFEKIYDIGMNTRTGPETTAELFGRMGMSLRDYYSPEKLIELTEAVSYAAALSGTSTGEMQGALVQFSQALGNNFEASAQELNSIIEQAPALANAIADAVGVSVGELKKLAKDGKLTREQVVEGMIELLPDLKDQFSDMTVTASQGFNVLMMGVTRWFGELNRGFNFSGMIGSRLNILGQALVESARGLKEDIATAKAFFAGAAETVATVLELGKILLFEPVSDYFAGLTANIVAYAQGLWARVSAPFIEFRNNVEFVFWYLYDVIVGNSYWPDLILEVGAWATKLWGLVSAPLQRFKSGVESLFKGMFKGLETIAARSSAVVGRYLGKLSENKKLKSLIKSNFGDFLGLFKLQKQLGIADNKNLTIVLKAFAKYAPMAQEAKRLYNRLRAVFEGASKSVTAMYTTFFQTFKTSLQQQRSVVKAMRASISELVNLPTLLASAKTSYTKLSTSVRSYFSDLYKAVSQIWGDSQQLLSSKLEATLNKIFDTNIRKSVLDKGIKSVTGVYKRFKTVLLSFAYSPDLDRFGLFTNDLQSGALGLYKTLTWLESGIKSLDFGSLASRIAIGIAAVVAAMTPDWTRLQDVLDTQKNLYPILDKLKEGVLTAFGYLAKALEVSVASLLITAATGAYLYFSEEFRALIGRSFGRFALVSIIPLFNSESTMQLAGSWASDLADFFMKSLNKELTGVDDSKVRAAIAKTFLPFNNDDPLTLDVNEADNSIQRVLKTITNITQAVGTGLTASFANALGGDPVYWMEKLGSSMGQALLASLMLTIMPGASILRSTLREAFGLFSFTGFDAESWQGRLQRGIGLGFDPGAAPGANATREQRDTYNNNRQATNFARLAVSRAAGALGGFFAGDVLARSIDIDPNSMPGLAVKFGSAIGGALLTDAFTDAVTRTLTVNNWGRRLIIPISLFAATRGFLASDLGQGFKDAVVTGLGLPEIPEEFDALTSNLMSGLVASVPFIVSSAGKLLKTVSSKIKTLVSNHKKTSALGLGAGLAIGTFLGLQTDEGRAIEDAILEQLGLSTISEEFRSALELGVITFLAGLPSLLVTGLRTKLAGPLAAVIATELGQGFLENFLKDKAGLTSLDAKAGANSAVDGVLGGILGYSLGPRNWALGRAMTTGAGALGGTLAGAGGSIFENEKVSKIITGALQGGVLGSAIGPWGALGGAVLGGGMSALGEEQITAILNSLGSGLVMFGELLTKIVGGLEGLYNWVVKITGLGTPTTPEDYSALKDAQSIVNKKLNEQQRRVEYLKDQSQNSPFASTRQQASEKLTDAQSRLTELTLKAEANNNLLSGFWKQFVSDSEASLVALRDRLRTNFEKGLELTAQRDVVESQIQAKSKQVNSTSLYSPERGVLEAELAALEEEASRIENELAELNFKGLQKFLPELETAITTAQQSLTPMENVNAKGLVEAVDSLTKRLNNIFFFNYPGYDSGWNPFNLRGNATKYATGGWVSGPGTGTSDSVPAMLSNGEFVINAESTKKYLPLLQAINSGSVAGFADGGAVGSVTGYSWTDPELLVDAISRGTSILVENFGKINSDLADVVDNKAVLLGLDAQGNISVDRDAAKANTDAVKFEAAVNKLLEVGIPIDASSPVIYDLVSSGQVDVMVSDEMQAAITQLNSLETKLRQLGYTLTDKARQLIASVGSLGFKANSLMSTATAGSLPGFVKRFAAGALKGMGLVNSVEPAVVPDSGGGTGGLGAGGGGGGGGGTADKVRTLAEAIKDLEKNIKEAVTTIRGELIASTKMDAEYFAQMGADGATEMQDAFKGSLSGFLKGDMSFGDAIGNLLDTFTSKLIDNFVDGFVNSIFNKNGLSTKFQDIFSGAALNGAGAGGGALGQHFLPREDEKGFASSLVGVAGGAPVPVTVVNGLGAGVGAGGLPGVGTGVGAEGAAAGTQGFFSTLFNSLTSGLKGLFSGITNLFSGLFGGGGGGGLFSFLGGLFGHADGGRIVGPGTGTSDSIPAMLSNGEFIVRAASAKRYLPVLEAINSGSLEAFATGGRVGVTNPKAFAKATQTRKGTSVFNINVTGDVSRQTRKEIVQMLPEISLGVNNFNREGGNS